MTLQGRIYTISKQGQELDANAKFLSMIQESVDNDVVVIDGRNIAAGSIYASQIHSDSITADHLRADAITSDHITAGVITGDKITSGVIRSQDNSMEIDLNNGTINLSKPLVIDSRKVATEEFVETNLADTIKNIEVGGRNLLRDSGIEVTNELYNIARYDLTDEIKQGEEVTLTIWGSLAATKRNFTAYNSGGSVSLVTLTDNGDGTYSRTFKWAIGSSTNTYLNVFAFTNAQTGTSTINKIKLERGNTATDWTEAPEDTQLDINKKTYNPVRYIRDWANGSTANTGNHWGEIQAIQYSTGENIAKGKPVTSNGTLSNATRATDGVINTSYANGPAGYSYVEVDLGQVYYDIESVLVSHYYVDGRTYYQTKTEVSADGVNWIPVFDSVIEGEYEETSSGKTFPNTQARAESLLANQETMKRLGDPTSMVTIDGGHITAGQIKSKNNYSWISLENGQFNLGNGGLIYNSSGLTVNGKLSVTNLDGYISKDKLDASVKGDLAAGADANTTVSANKSKWDSAEANAKGYTDGAIGDIEIGGKNLLVQRTITTGGFLTSTGAFSSNAAWFYTDYIPVAGYTKLITSGYTNLGNGPSVVYYDSNFAFVKGIANGGVSRAKEITIEPGIAYIRFSGEIKDLPTLKIEKGNIATDWTESEEDRAYFASQMGTQQLVPGQPPHNSGGAMHNSNHGQFIEISEDILIGKTMINSSYNGELTVQIREGHGAGNTVLQEKTFTIKSGIQWINLNFLLIKSQGTKYTLMAPIRGGNLYRNQGVTNYPLDAGSFKITSSIGGSTYYYYFHNLHVSGKGVVGEEYINNTATDAKSAAATAQTTADTAIANASTANSAITDMMSDLKITPIEKTELARSWERIKAEYTQLNSQAASLAVASATRTNYTNAYNALNTTAPRIQTDILASMTTNYNLTTTTRNTFKAQMNAYFVQAETISKAITDKIQANASSAQSTADTANTAATNAKSKTDKWTWGDTTEIDGGAIRTKTIEAEHIKANSLSTLSANLGTVTAGTIRSKDNAIDINLDTGTINLSRPLTINSLPVSTKKEVEDAIQDIEIGGRNYFVRTNINNIAVSGTALTSGSNWKGFSFPVEEGAQYTIHRTDTTNNRWQLYWVNTDEVEGSTDYTLVFSANTQESHVANTAKVPVGAKWGYLYLSNSDPDGSTIPNIMIEKGNIATDWTEAPEDIKVIEIGGRNYFSYLYHSDRTNFEFVTDKNISIEPLELEPNTQYMLSYSDLSIIENGQYRLAMLDSTGEVAVPIFEIENETIDEHFGSDREIEFVTDDVGTYNFSYYVNGIDGTIIQEDDAIKFGEWFTDILIGFQIEKGNISTEYKDSIEDTQMKIDKKADAIDLDNYVPVEGYENEIGEINTSLQSYMSVLEQSRDDIYGLYETVLDEDGNPVLDEDGNPTETLVTDDEGEIVNPGVIAEISDLLNRSTVIENNLGEFTSTWNFLESKIIMGEEGMLVGEYEFQLNPVTEEEEPVLTSGIMIGSDRIDFVNGNHEEPVAFITGNVLQINHGIFVKTLQVGEHMLETRVGGHTIWQWIDPQEEEEQ